MGTLATGITFIPASTSNEQWRLMVLHRTLEAVGGVQHIKEAFIPAERTNHLSLEQRCERAVLSMEHGGGYLVFDIAGFETTFRFLRPNSQAQIPYVVLELPRHSFASELVGDPMRIELFAAEWSRLCEIQGAELAYFSEGFPNEEDQRVQEFMNALQNDDLLEMVGGNWRTYLSPTLTTRLQQQLKRLSLSRAEILPSGAYIFRSGRGYNPIMGNANDETFLQAEFLAGQIRLHPKIDGSERLLALIDQEVQALQAIEAQPNEERYYERSHENMAVQDQARKDLFQIRATWACALQSTDLVGVAQLVKSEGDGEGGTSETVEVPVIADGGRTWVYPTLLYPFNLDDKEWTDPGEGLEMCVFTLLEAARHNPVAGEPPRVVVYFWRGVSQGVREALGEMGAKVEVADRLPVLD